MLLDTRGSIVENKQLAKITWLRVGVQQTSFLCLLTPKT